jgi:hypothetical protein
VDTDAIDKLLEAYVQQHQLRVPIIRLDHSKYLIGTRFIVAAIRDGALTVRVGGGFMDMQEFESKHQQIEIEKLRKLVLKEQKDPLEIMHGIIERQRGKKQ